MHILFFMAGGFVICGIILILTFWYDAEPDPYEIREIETQYAWLLRLVEKKNQAVNWKKEGF